MFDSLDDKMKADDAAEVSRKERIVKMVIVAILSVLLFAGLYYAVRLLE
jgi:hypothetical protein